MIAVAEIGDRDIDTTGVVPQDVDDELAALAGADLASTLSELRVCEADDDSLLTIATAWRRLGSWAKAGELTAVSTFLKRRRAEGRDSDAAMSAAMDAAAAEVQLALGRLTNEALSQLLLLAKALDGPLPGTRQAMETGRIDEAKAQVIAQGVRNLHTDAAGEVERRVLAKAGEQSTGQLRATVAKTVLHVDPEGVVERRRTAETRRYVELRADDEHTARLAGRHLPVADAVAADNRISAIAQALKADGDPRTLRQLRADTLTALLLGTFPTSRATDPSDNPGADPGAVLGIAPVVKPSMGSLSESVSPHNPTTGGHRPVVTTALHITVTDEELRRGDRRTSMVGEAETESSARSRRQGGRTPAEGPASIETPVDPLAGPTLAAKGQAAEAPSLSGSSSDGGHHSGREILVITPLATLAGDADLPGEMVGYGPIPAASVRALTHENIPRRCCYSILDRDGQVIHHGHLPPRRFDRIDLHQVLDEIAADIGDRWDGSGCSGHHQNDPPGAYQIRGALRHKVEIRDRTCRFPGCRRPAIRCDIDHTRPWQKGGPSCACNLSALCRRHHQIKQAWGWTLTQPQPGHLIWTTPTGRSYHTEPDGYPGAELAGPTDVGTPYDPRVINDKASFEPLVMFEYDHDPGRFCLILSDTHMVKVNEVFEECGEYGNGYGWAGVARQAMRAHAPEITEHIDLDPEAGMMSAQSTDPEKLQRLGTLLRDAFHDRTLLAELIRGAEPEWLD